jgi:hypothetical protein
VHTCRHHVSKEPSRKYFAALHKQQTAFQKTERNALTEYLSTKVRDQRMVTMGRLPADHDAGPLYSRMMAAMMKGTWCVFETAIGAHLKEMDRSFEDFESLRDPNSLINTLISNHAIAAENITTAHLNKEEHDWVGALAARLLKSGFTISDVCRLELLAHLFTIQHSPVRPQAILDTKASHTFAVLQDDGRPRLIKVRAFRSFMATRVFFACRTATWQVH